MSFVAILVSLLLDRFLRQLEPLRAPAWFDTYIISLRGLGGVRSGASATLAAILVAVLPAALVWLVGILLSGVWTVLTFVFAVVVLLFSLGPRDLTDEAGLYIEALETGDDARAVATARTLLGFEPPAEAGQRTRAVTEAVLAQGNDRLFAVLFWFAVLGPAGAILYRCADLLRRRERTETAGGDEFAHAAIRLHGILAWLPAHITAFAYALAGSFDGALSDLRAYYADCTTSFFHVNDDVLVCTGRGALSRTVGEETGPARVQAALRLVKRALVIWLVPLGLLTLAGWWA